MVSVTKYWWRGGGGVGEFFAGITWFSGGTGGSVVANRVHRGSLKKLTGGEGERVKRILESLKGRSGKFYRDTYQILHTFPPAAEAMNNDGGPKDVYYIVCTYLSGFVWNKLLVVLVSWKLFSVSRCHSSLFLAGLTFGYFKHSF